MSIEQRQVLRPEHFTVAPQLLGLPLAPPSRRLWALLIDLLLVAILVRAGGGFALALAAAWAFFRFAGRMKVKQGTSEARARGRKRMWLLRAAGAFMLFLVVRDAWEKTRSAGARMVRFASGSAASTPAPPAPIRAGFDVAGGMIALQTADDRPEASRAAGQVVRGMRDAGASDAAIREALMEAAGESPHAWMGEVVRAALPTAPEGRAAAPADSLLAWHVAALGRGDAAGADTLRRQLASALARDSLDLLQRRVGELQESQASLRARAEEAENGGLLARILQTLDELGIGFGWTGLYFTVLTTLWRGQTPGKRLLGVRVVRLNGEPMTLWMSFERFGGYAAGLFTGLMGFAQVYWDRNRQAIHDKITETVVVLDVPIPAAPPPGEAPRRTLYRAPT